MTLLAAPLILLRVSPDGGANVAAMVIHYFPLPFGAAGAVYFRFHLFLSCLGLLLLGFDLSGFLTSDNRTGIRYPKEQL